MKQLLFALTIITAMTACTGVRVVEYNPNDVQLNEFETFAWQDSPLDPATGSQLAIADEAIRAEVTEVLISKGYRLNETAPELLVSWHVGRAEVEIFEEDMRSVDESVGDSMQRDMAHEGDLFRASSNMVEVDQLLISFVDRECRSPLVVLEIRSVSDGQMTNGEVSRRVVEAVDKALKQVPRRN